MKLSTLVVLLLGISLQDVSGIHLDLSSFFEEIAEGIMNLKYYREEVPDDVSGMDLHADVLRRFQNDGGDLLSLGLEQYEAGPESFAPTVVVPDLGTARGRIMKTLWNKQFYSFQSIPYGIPPEGDLRFKMTSVNTAPWPKDLVLGDGSEYYDATYLRAKCPQGSFAVPINTGREDCLHVSIYTPPNFTNTSNFPVLFFIHGGSFTTGDASFYMPTKLMETDDMVTVIVQYRLGSLGFLSASNSDCPGNMGLMDQVLALRWVQKYISHFGGNPDEVTVMGQSAGGASASWMQMTPQTRPDYPDNNGKALMKRILAMSGSALELWTLDTTPEESFILQADAVGCQFENDTAASLVCMREKDLNTLVHGFNQIVNDDRRQGGLGFVGNSPVIQDSAELADMPELIVIDKHPLTTVHLGEALPVDLLAGSVRDEGSLVASLMYLSFMEVNGRNLSKNEFFLQTESVPLFVHAFGIDDLTGAVANTMQLQFLKNADMTDWDSMSGGLVDMTGELFLKTGLWSLASLLDTFNPNNTIFFYSFEFESDDSIFDWIFIGHDNYLPVEGGITHADDLLYTFCMPNTFDEREKSKARAHSMLLTNFVKYGHPTPEEFSVNDDWTSNSEPWHAFTTESLNYLLIQDTNTMQQDFRRRWNYNTIPDPESVSETAQFEKMTHSEEYYEERMAGFKIATAVLGTLCAGLILMVSYLFIKR